jgi:hypothetical protein
MAWLTLFSNLEWLSLLRFSRLLQLLIEVPKTLKPLNSAHQVPPLVISPCDGLRRILLTLLAWTSPACISYQSSEYKQS